VGKTRLGFFSRRQKLITHRAPIGDKPKSVGFFSKGHYGRKHPSPGNISDHSTHESSWSPARGRHRRKVFIAGNKTATRFEVAVLCG